MLEKITKWWYSKQSNEPEQSNEPKQSNGLNANDFTSARYLYEEQEWHVPSVVKAGQDTTETQGERNPHGSAAEEPTKPEFTLTPDQIQQLKNSENNPKVVVLYDKEGGTTYADKMVDYLKQQGIETILVTPKEGLNHPVFKEGKIDGFYLPGGPDVVQNDPRTNFEGQIINYAEENGTPIMGICRGLQTITHHHGSKIDNIPEDDEGRQPHYNNWEEVYNETQDPNYNNKVVVRPGSQLYNALQYQLKSENNEPIEYNTTCLHQQHAHVNNNNNNNVKVTGSSKSDGLVESIEKKNSKGRYYTIAYQHHPEGVKKACEEAREEKLTEIETKAEQQRLETHFTDCGSALSDLLKKDREQKEAYIKSRDEQVAEVEMNLFVDQVKQNFLEKETLQNPGSPTTKEEYREDSKSESNPKDEVVGKKEDSTISSYLNWFFASSKKKEPGSSSTTPSYTSGNYSNDDSGSSWTNDNTSSEPPSNNLGTVEGNTTVTPNSGYDRESHQCDAEPVAIEKASITENSETFFAPPPPPPPSSSETNNEKENNEADYRLLLIE